MLLVLPFKTAISLKKMHSSLRMCHFVKKDQFHLYGNKSGRTIEPITSNKTNYRQNLRKNPSLRDILLLLSIS